MFGSRLLYNPGIAYTVIVDNLSVYEGQVLTYTVYAPTTANGTTLYWSTSGTVVAADFSDSTLTGSFTITNGIGSFTRTPVYDATAEGAETMTIQIRTGSVAGTIVATADTVTVNDGVSLTGGSTSLEGANAVFTLSYKTNSYTFYWEVVLGTATADDFGALSGTVVTSSTGSPATVTVNVPIATDNIDDAGETYYVRIRDTNSSGNIMYTSGALAISQPTVAFASLPSSTYYNDLGNTPSYTSNAITEGTSGTFTVTMPTWASQTTTLYWTTLNGNTTDSDFTSTSGSFVTSYYAGNSTVAGTFSIPVATDALSDPDKTFQAQVRWGSNTGYVLATSSNVTIKQQEIAFGAPSSNYYSDLGNTYYYDGNSITEGGTGSFQIQTKRSYTDTQTLYWTILHGTTSNSDFSAVSGSFTTSAYSAIGGGNAVVGITTVLTDGDPAVAETFQLEIRENSVTGPVIGTSQVITIKPQEIAFGAPSSNYYSDLGNTYYYDGNSITEGGTGSFQIQTKRSYTTAQTLYWTILHGTTSNSDFSSVTGSFATTAYSALGGGNAVVGITTLISDNDTTNNETFQLEIRENSFTGPVIGTSQAITIRQQEVAFSAPSSIYYSDLGNTLYADGNSITEGGTGVFNIQTKRSYTTAQTLYWNIVHGTTTNSDFSAVTGNFTTTAYSAIGGGNGIVNITTVLSDSDTTNNETFQLEIRENSNTGPVIGTSQAITIRQQEVAFSTPSSIYYNSFGNAASADGNSITEGGTGVFNIQTKRSYTTTQTLYWTILHGNTSNSDFSAVSGSFATTVYSPFGGGNGIVNITTVLSDSDTTNNETFQLEIRENSITGPVIGTSQAITIRQQEVAFSIPGSTKYDPFANTLTSTANAVTEGGTMNLNVQTIRSYTNAQTLYWTIDHLTTVDADFGNTVSGTLTTNLYATYGGGNAIVNIATVLTDGDIASDETFQVRIRENSTTGPTIGLSQVMTIKPQEVAFFTPLSYKYDPFANTATATSNAVTEGGTMSLNVQTVRSYTSAQTLYWTILHGTTANADFGNTVSGTLTTNLYATYGGGNAVVSIATVLTDGDIASDETFQVEIRENSTSGPIIGTSQVMTIKPQEVAFSIPGSTKYDPFANTATSTANAVTEGGTMSLNVQTVRSYTNTQTLYWTILHGTTANTDFSAVSGNVTTSLYSTYGGGNAIVNIATVLTDGDIASDETFQVEIRENSITGPVIGTSQVMTIKPQEVAFSNPGSLVYTGGANTGSYTANAVTEGGTMGLNVQTVRSYTSAQTLYWTISHLTTVDADFSAVSGNFTTSLYSTYGGGNAVVNITTVLTDGDAASDETFQVQIRENSTSGPIIGTSQVMTIKPQEIYFRNPGSTVYTSGANTTSSTANAITEGTTGVFGIQTIRSYTSAQTLYWTILHGTTTNADFSTVSGTLTTDNTQTTYGGGYTTVSVATVAADADSGSETFQLQIRENSITGPVIGTSSAITIMPQEVYFYSLATTVAEGATLSVGVQLTRGYSTTQTLYWTILHGTTADADFTAVNGSFSIAANVTYNASGTFSVVTATDALSESTETFQIQIREASVTGPVIGTSSSISLTNVTPSVGTWVSETYSATAMTSNDAAGNTTHVVITDSAAVKIRVTAIGSGTWSTITLPSASTAQNPGYICYGGGKWVILGSSLSCSWTCSGDPTVGANWTVTNFTQLSAYGGSRSLIYFGTQYVYMILDSTYTIGRFVYSSNGTAWSTSTSTVTLAYSSDAGKMTTDNASSILMTGASGGNWYYYSGGTITATSAFTKSASTGPWFGNSYGCAWTTEAGWLAVGASSLTVRSTSLSTFSPSTTITINSNKSAYIARTSATVARLIVTPWTWTTSDAAVSIDGGITWSTTTAPADAITYPPYTICSGGTNKLYLFGWNYTKVYVLTLP